MRAKAQLWRSQMRHDFWPPTIRRVLLWVLLCGVAAASDPLWAQTGSGPVLYRLNKDSSFVQGCFPPCLCPIMIAVPARGTFLLSPTGFDGLFNNYTATDVNWLVSVNGKETVVTGSGTRPVGSHCSRGLRYLHVGWRLGCAATDASVAQEQQRGARAF